jgi:Na+/proline symporter
MSIFYRGYTKNGALASMVVGFFSVMFFQFVAPKIGGIGAYLEKLSALPPSFALAMLAGYLASRWKPDLELQKFYTDNFR